jgi:uncharacterized membrane protein YdcZ (DUF606 family)
MTGHKINLFSIISFWKYFSSLTILSLVKQLIDYWISNNNWFYIIIHWFKRESNMIFSTKSKSFPFWSNRSAFFIIKYKFSRISFKMMFSLSHLSRCSTMTQIKSFDVGFSFLFIWVWIQQASYLWEERILKNKRIMWNLT